MDLLGFRVSILSYSIRGERGAVRETSGYNHGLREGYRERDDGSIMVAAERGVERERERESKWDEGKIHVSHPNLILT